MPGDGVVSPGPDLFALDVAITVGLALALPLARGWAGARLGESRTEQRRAAGWTAAGMFAWLAFTGALAGSGVLAQWDRFPPPAMPLLFGSTVLVTLLASSRFGGRLATGLPLWILVGYQGFRIPVEVMLHRAYEQGVIGVQMTWSGRNFDVVTGVAAVVIGGWLWSRGEERAVPKSVVWAWNVVGLGLLINVVTIAVVSLPTPMRMFEGPANEWVARFPYVWLPTVMVMAALMGHLLVGRRLIQR